MGNLSISIKKFLKNKNTVTIIGVLFGVVLLYFAYNKRVNEAINPILVPYAKQAIGATTVITEDMIDMVEVSNSLVKHSSNLITNKYQLIGKKVASGYSVPENGLFYTNEIVDADSGADSVYANIPDGYTVYTLKVNLKDTYGNSIYPGNYIDLYFKATDDNTNKYMYGKFIESIEVLDVRDSAGNRIFGGATDVGTPSELLFAVPDELYLLLSQAEKITSNNVQFFPVPRNRSYTVKKGETKVTSSYVTNFIKSKAVTLPDEVLNN